MKPPSEHYKRRKEWGDTRLAEEWTSVFSLAMPLSCFKNILLVSASNRHWFCFTCLHYSIQWFITKEQFNVFNSHGLHEHDASFRYQCDNYARLQRKCHELYHSPGITNFVLMFINLTWFKSYTYSLSLLVCVCKSQEGRKKKKSFGGEVGCLKGTKHYNMCMTSMTLKWLGHLHTSSTNREKNKRGLCYVASSWFITTKQ